jgi:hypothetical protein
MMTPKVRRSLHEKFLFSLNNDLTESICGHCSDKERLRVTHFNWVTSVRTCEQSIQVYFW